LVHTFFVFGFDSDEKSIFEKTLKFLMGNKICSAGFCILTPYPNLKFFKELKEQKRILTYDWRYYNHYTTVFSPKNMTAAELQDGKDKLKENFYSIYSILKRLFGNLDHPLIFLAVNFSWRKDALLVDHELEKNRNQFLKYDYR